MTFRTLSVATFFGLALANPCLARPWIHDQDSNKIDDRIEQVHELGREHAFERNDPSKRLRIALFEDPIVDDRPGSASISDIDSIPVRRS